MKAFIRTLVASLAVWGLTASNSQAGPTIIVETVAFSPATGTQTNQVSFTGVSGSWGDSSGKSTAPGCTIKPASAPATISVKYAGTASFGIPAFKIVPTLPTAGGTYDVEVTHTTSGANCSPDLVASVGVVGGSGLPATTDGFQASKGANTWYKIGTLSLDSGITQPEITFTYSSGTLASTGGRFYADAVRFVEVAATPAIVSQPQSLTNVLQGGFCTFSVQASGIPPLSYQWYFGANPITGETNTTLKLTNVQSSAQGSYKVKVSNNSGFIDSSAATLTVQTVPLSSTVTPLWRAVVGDTNNYSYLEGSANTHRGFGYNPATDHLMLPIRNAVNAIVGIFLVNGADGANVGTLDSSGITGGALPINTMDAADDGAIFACNVALASPTAGNAFKLYRWDNEVSSPAIIYGDGATSPDNTIRWGDSIDVRGAGTNTQVIVSGQTGGKVTIFTTADGTTFTPNVLTCAGAASDSSIIGVHFGPGNSYFVKSWGAAATNTLRHISFDLATSTATVIKSYTTNDIPATLGPIAYDTTSGLFVGNVSRGVPDSFRIFANVTTTPTWIDTEYFGTDNFNSQGTGAVRFGNNNRVFSLDTNNGLYAGLVNYVSAPTLSYSKTGNQLTFTWTGSFTLQEAATVNGPWNNVVGAVSGHQVSTASGTKFYRLKN